MLIPVTAGRVQVKVAPGVVLVGVYVKFAPLQIDGGVNALLNEAIELLNNTESEAIPLATANK